MVTVANVVCPRCSEPAAPAAVSRGLCARCGAELAVMPAIDISQLAPLDEVLGTGLLPDAAFAPPPARPAAPDPRFAPPPAFAPPADEEMSDDAPIGVERSTRAIRIENQWRLDQALEQPTAVAPPVLSQPASPADRASLPLARASTRPERASARPERASRRPIIGFLVALALIAAVTYGIIAVVVVRQPAGQRAADTVSIRITARVATDVSIDGAAAGKTPLTLQRPRSTKPVLITTHGAVLQVTPDRDQLVDVSPL